MKVTTLLLTIALTGFALPAWAADDAMPMAAAHDMSKMNLNPSKEEREKMATAHAEMTVCLRSDKEFAICRDAFHKECQSMMGGSCPGMDMKNGMHKGMKRKK